MLWNMLKRGLDGAQESCRRLQAAAVDGARLTAEAHRLRGTAGTFGFARLAALAGAIEVRVGEGAEAADLVAGLQAIMDATRGAVDLLRESGEQG